MKLPRIAIIVGLLAGIGLTIFLRPETAAGSALLIIVSTLVVTLVGLLVDRFRPTPAEAAKPGDARD